MRCSTCKREMVALFLTRRCDHCDFGPELWRMRRGFVVYAEPDCTLPACARLVPQHYVFRTHADACRWKDMASVPGDVRAVLSPRPFRWILSPRLGIVLAGSECVVHPDHRYPDAVDEVFLAPKMEGE